ncbi:hypothetical protein KQI58_01540 [Enterococcus raffinosus]|uniref:hypothetical protein n=1 Tax=Enterococcus raffinosus TaxID=71452 RepID=UPI001C114901|nr:hypothetical protein [Enterococcus raffinosus]MBU5359756.1 hypothetical protein [Enterococcus raffinosus]
MLGIDNELEQLYKKAQQNGKAVIKDRWTSGNYGCCSTRAPLIEKYRIENTETKISLYLWGTQVVEVTTENHKTIVNADYKATNYDKKIIDWFVQKVQKA